MIIAAFAAFAMLVIAWIALPSPTMSEPVDFAEEAEEGTLAA